MLVFDSTGPMERPAHFVLIRLVGKAPDHRDPDFLFAPYGKA